MSLNTRLVRRSLSANRVRLLLTSFSIIIGVGFITASFVLADGLRDSFERLSVSANRADLTVRSMEEINARLPFTDTLIKSIAKVPGVTAAIGQVETERIQPVMADGKPVTTPGPPQLGFAWTDSPASPFRIKSGTPPTKDAEFVLDDLTATANNFEVGKTYDLLTPTGTHRATLVGTTLFGPDNVTLGATLTHVTFGQAQRWFGLVGQVQTIAVVIDTSADRTTVEAGIAELLPERIEIASQATLTSETEDEYGAISNILGSVLLAFAFLSLFVSSFIIANTYSVVVTQRIRELALMRALGASSVQIRRLVLSEAGVVGLSASIIGIAIGVGLAAGIRVLFDALGLGLPAADVILKPRTLITALLSGTVVTVLAALRPARRAAAILPIAAMAASTTGAEQVLPRRVLVIGGISGAVGVASGIVGFAVDGQARTVALATAALCSVIAVLLTAPRLATPFVQAIGFWLPRIFRVSGKLGLSNTQRNPRRTATTASALTIGLTVVTSALVIGASIKDHLRETVSSAFDPDTVVVYSSGALGVPSELPFSIKDAFAKDPTFSSVTSVRNGRLRIDSTPTKVTGTEVEKLTTLVDAELLEGQFSFEPDNIAFLDTVATARSIDVGDTVSAELTDGSTRPLKVSAIYGSDTTLGDAMITLDWWELVNPSPTDAILVAKFDELITETQRTERIQQLNETFPQSLTQTPTQLAERITTQVDQLLMVINLLMALTVIIALLGIANTLGLAVYERTREIGLLRAVGMPRHQVRRFIRIEAALVATFGAFLGIALGVGLGVMTSIALPESAANGAKVPIATIISLAAIAILAGIVSAYRPARRAARLDILEAIQFG
jgi:putative ABC transport system permease protein